MYLTIHCSGNFRAAPKNSAELKRYHQRKNMIKSILLAIVCLSLIGCGSKGKTTKTVSSAFSTKQEKIQFLEQYVKFKRSYTKLDFNIDYQDNSTGLVPGPSDWDISIVASVPSSELNEWITGLSKLEETPDKTWLKKIPTEIDYSGITEWYKLEANSVVGINRNSNIVVYRNFKY